MHAVVLSFPGHFWQTQLCVQRLLHYYHDINIMTFILDDVDASTWNQYSKDFVDAVTKNTEVDMRFVKVSDLGKIAKCPAGWWRQQLIKLTLDEILDDSSWFVVDGDVIFGSKIDVAENVPISRRGDFASNWSKMCVNYVRDVIGQGPGFLTMDETPVITSAIPFRHLDRDLLTTLRAHVEARFQSDFVTLHLNWFDDQTIVADISPPTRWVMSEWELIESFRRNVLDQDWPFLDIGSGYPIDCDLQAQQGGINVFHHAYLRDAEIGPKWFQDHGIEIDSMTWTRSQHWYDQHESDIRA